MQTITTSMLDELINFTPADSNASKSVGELQQEGTVAAFNMLATNGCAYLADEVGMGKTYIALGIMNLLRYFDPHTRVIMIAPRQNIQEKWKKELTNFVRNNWKVTGNRVKSLDGTPVWEPVICENLAAFAREALHNQDRDFFLRMTSFSLQANETEVRKKQRDRLVEAIPWLQPSQVDPSSYQSFIDSYAVAFNGAIPNADLVIVDEAHNLRQGFGENVSTRNRLMGLAFGHRHGQSLQRDWFKQKAKRVLFLSATPFEDDYASIYHQLSLFGFENTDLKSPNGAPSLNTSLLTDANGDPDVKRQIVERLMIRRTSGIMINGKKHTKNMYRREWRGGGVKTYDESIQISDPQTKLVVALMQKKLTEILQTDKFSNQFQIGMLSSFESFSESLRVAKRTKDLAEVEASQDVQSEDADSKPTFDGSDQQQSLGKEVREGIDSTAISEITQSYFQTFSKKLPHPKLDQVSSKLREGFESGEKVLVFVRRVATVGELASKLNVEFNARLRERMLAALPGHEQSIDQLFRRYQDEYRDVYLGQETPQIQIGNLNEELEPIHDIERLGDLKMDDDAGGMGDFFEWFFRGTGPSGVLSGAAFQRNRLLSTSSVYSTLFEDNYVADLLNSKPASTLHNLSSFLQMSTAACLGKLREMAYAYFNDRSSQRIGYPRLYVFESYQFAALTLLAETTTVIGGNARVVLQERYPDGSLTHPNSVPEGYPHADEQLAITTLFTELRNKPSLREALWPAEPSGEFRQSFRRREQRRELFSAMTRLGAAYIDLYLIAIRNIGSFELRSQEQEPDVAVRLAREFVAELTKQSQTPGFHAYYELSEAAANFNVLVSVNFPDIEQQSLPSLARYLGIQLGHQTPIGEVSGQLNRRVVAQFRMPGFPLVLISTDVLQEGEDLHTFCKHIMHYGIAWTPSALEQRNGRIDRIGGLVQRNLDGHAREPDDNELIQVFYPHLRDTVELLQVRRVFRRLNAFLELMHEDQIKLPAEETYVDTKTEILDGEEDIPQYRDPLRSAFEVDPQWLAGDLDASSVRLPEWSGYLEHFESLRDWLRERKGFTILAERVKHAFEGELDFPDGSQGTVTKAKFVIRLRSHVAGEETLLLCESAVTDIDLDSAGNIKRLRRITSRYPNAKICIEPRISKSLDRVFIRREILYDPKITQPVDLEFLFDSVVPVAARLHLDLVTQNAKTA